MEKKKRSNIYANHVVFLLGGFLIFMMLGLCIFLVRMQKDVEQSSLDGVKTNVEKQSEHLRTVINIHLNYLSGLADHVSQQDSLDNEDNLELLQSFGKEQGLDLLAVIDQDGNASYSNGQKKSVADRPYFKKAIRGERSMSRPLMSAVDGKTKVILAVPIYKNNKVIGVLGASYNVGALNQMLFDDVYRGVGFSMIVSPEGDIISCDSGLAYRKIHMEDNVFKFYVEEGCVSKKNMGNTMKNFANQKSGNMILSMPEGDWYFSYVPLEINDWMLCYVVPVSKAQESFHFIQKRETILFLLMVCSAVTFFLILLKSSELKQKELKDISMTDGLTNVYNKTGTEDMINQWLAGEGKESSAAFLMMDVDYFKNINDTYGHAMGDTVLCKVGHLLKTSFREKDIIGRVGGDEFIVLVKGVSSEEFMIRRMKQIQRYFAELLVEGMEGYQFTCSMGLAFTPDDGKKFIDLYKCADVALYETKRKGRNGFTVYRQTEEIRTDKE